MFPISKVATNGKPLHPSGGRGGGGYYYPRYLYEAQFVHYRLSYYASTYDCSSCSKSSMLNYLSKS